MVRHIPRSRRGSALAEGLLVLIPFTMMMLALVELGLWVQRCNSLSAAARYVARQASLHGEFAPARGPGWSGPWDPRGPYPNIASGSRYRVRADANEPIADAVRPYIVGFRKTDVFVTLEWIDSINRNTPVRNNKVGTSVWVMVEGPSPNTLLDILGLRVAQMGSSSVMTIEH